MNETQTENNEEDRENYLKEICKIWKIDDEMLNLILDAGSSWKGTKKNARMTQKLKRKNILIKQGRGKYIVNKAFLLVTQNRGSVRV